MDIDKATSYAKNPLDAANQAMIYGMIVGDHQYKTEPRIPYRDSVKPWELSITVSGGLIPLSNVIYNIRKIVSEFRYTCEIQTNMNLLVFKKITFKIRGTSTEKRALKLKSKLEDYIHQF